jgi:hypothetical protein
MLNAAGGCCTVAIGSSALAGAVSGNDNIAAGTNAGFGVTSGCSNLIMGFSAGCAITSGNFNTVIGPLAGQTIVGGCGNVAIGRNVVVPATPLFCSNNLAIGFSATDNWLTGCPDKNIRPGGGILSTAGTLGTNGQFLTACNNGYGVCWTTASGLVANATPTVAGIILGCSLVNLTALGCNAANLVTGIANTAIGAGAASVLTTGISNTVIGNSALSGAGSENVSGNTAVGANALRLNTGNFNTALGCGAGNLAISGCHNLLIGARVEIPVTAGCYQLAIGSDTNFCWLTGCSDKSIRPQAGIVDCAGNLGNAGQVLASNGSNALVWCSAGGIPCATITGAGALIVGSAVNTPATLAYPGDGNNGCVLTLCSTAPNKLMWANPNNLVSIPNASHNQSGAVFGFTNNVLDANTGLGAGLNFCPSRVRSVQVGWCAGANLNTSDTVLVGYFAGTNVNSSQAVGIGSCAFQSRSGAGAVAIGYQAAFTNGGSDNVAIGRCALYGQFSGTGNQNVAIGACTNITNCNGSNNVYIGHCAGNGLNNNCGITLIGGMRSDNSYAPAFALTAFDNDKIVVGSTATTNAYVRVSWTPTSDARDKTNVTALPVGLDFIKKLNPVSFQFKVSREDDTPHGPTRYGFLAQEVLEVEGDKPVLIDNSNPEQLGMTHDHINAILVKAIQELAAENEALKARLDAAGI